MVNEKGSQNSVNIKILDFAMLKLVKEVECHQGDVSFRVNKIVKMYSLAMDQISLPEFSEEEKCTLAECLTSSYVDALFVSNMHLSVQDHCYYNHDDLGSFEKSTLSKEDNALVMKVMSLDFLQRIKLIDMIDQEFFNG